jgi:hypothetical protein
LYRLLSTVPIAAFSALPGDRDDQDREGPWLPAPSAAGSANAEAFAAAFPLAGLVDAIAHKANDAEEDEEVRLSSRG